MMNLSFTRLNYILIVIIGLMIISPNLYSQKKIKELELLQYKEDVKFHELRDALQKQWKGVPEDERRGWKQFKRWEWFWSTRVKRDGSFPNPMNIYKDVRKFQQQDNIQNNTLDYKWEQMGPFKAPPGGQSSGIGRINIIRFNPLDTNEIWAGAASGGLWKSTDNGKYWQTFDFTQYMSLGISDIAVYPEDSDIVYAATGDADGAQAMFGPPSIGVLKTTDGGENWLLTNLGYKLEEKQIIGRILVHPENPDVVIAGTWGGIYKTTDGGESWELKSNSQGIQDMEFKPDDYNVIYASTRIYGRNSIYKSTDLGETWDDVYQESGTRRIAIAVTKAQSNYVYAIAAELNRTFKSLLRSNDAGDTWEIMSEDDAQTPDVLTRYDGFQGDDQGQAEYDLAIDAAPWDKNLIYVGGINMWMSSNGGRNWKQVTQSWKTENTAVMHVDIHDIIFHKKTNALYSAHDGGMDRSYDRGETWEELSDNMDITQFYRLGVSQTEENLVIGGCQDNGTNLLDDGNWEEVYGSDGMECIIDYENPQRIYASIYYGNIFRSTNRGRHFRFMYGPDRAGQSAAWLAPFVIDPQDPSTLYVGYNDVFKFDNYGTKNPEKISEFNSSVLHSLAVAPSNNNFIYAATYSSLHFTSDGGENWDRININRNPITYVAVDPENPRRIWITIGSYYENSKVWEYDGSEWTNLSGNLPNVPVNSIAYQENSPDRLFIGTDIGVFYSDYGSAYWQKYGSDMPNCIVSEVEIIEERNMIYVSTYGRGMWKIDLFDCNLPEAAINMTGTVDICEGDSVELTAQPQYSNYFWSTGERSKTIYAKESGAYSFIEAGPDGCQSKSQKVEVNMIQVNDMEINPGKGFPLCEGDSIDVILTATFGFSKYKWSTGETGRSITVTDTGTYSVTGETIEGCKAESGLLELKFAPVPDKPSITRIAEDSLKATEFKPIGNYSYKWYKNGLLMIGKNESVIKISNPGDYEVIVTNEPGCSSTSDVFTVESVSVNYLSEDENFTIIPNPGEGLFNIKLYSGLSGGYELKLTNNLGINILEKKIHVPAGELETKIDISEMSAGVYYLTIRHKSEIWFARIINE